MIKHFQMSVFHVVAFIWLLSACYESAPIETDDIFGPDGQNVELSTESEGEHSGDSEEHNVDTSYEGEEVFFESFDTLRTFEPRYNPFGNPNVCDCSEFGTFKYGDGQMATEIGCYDEAVLDARPDLPDGVYRIYVKWHSGVDPDSITSRGYTNFDDQGLNKS